MLRLAGIQQANRNMMLKGIRGSVITSKLAGSSRDPMKGQTSIKPSSVKIPIVAICQTKIRIALGCNMVELRSKYSNMII